MTAVRLEKLNEAQYAYDEFRRAELEGKGFEVTKTEKSAETDVAAKKSGNSKKAAGRSKGAKEEAEDVR